MKAQTPLASAEPWLAVKDNGSKAVDEDESAVAFDREVANS